MSLEKATLTRLANDASDREQGDPIPVQFNPASLRLTISNNTEGGTSTGRQQRQFTGNASTELSFDLVFDTADEDDGAGRPRSVREKTAMVEQFVLAQGSGSTRQSPPLPAVPGPPPPDSPGGGASPSVLVPIS